VPKAYILPLLFLRPVRCGDAPRDLSGAGRSRCRSTVRAALGV